MQSYKGSATTCPFWSYVTGARWHDRIFVMAILATDLNGFAAYRSPTTMKMSAIMTPTTAPTVVRKRP
jgi:hypothetical protein